MFNDTKIKQLSHLIGVSDLKLLEKGLKKQAKYLNISSTYLLKSFIVLHNIKKEYEEEKIKIDKYHTKNLIIAKYKEEIVSNYLQGMGYLKLSNMLALNHNATISKSSIEHFIKSNNITREL